MIEKYERTHQLGLVRYIIMQNHVSVFVFVFIYVFRDKKRNVEKYEKKTQLGNLLGMIGMTEKYERTHQLGCSAIEQRQTQL